MGTPPSDGHWAIVGKVGVIVAILVGLLNLYGLVRPKEPDLSCRCDAVQPDISLAFDQLHDGLVQVHTLTAKYEIKDRLRAAGVSGINIDDKVDQFASALSEAVRKSKITEFENVFDRERVFIKCDLLNTGRREAKGVIFKLPFTIGYARVDGVVIPRNQIDRESITLGSIKPGMKVSVSAWSDSYASPPYSGEQFLLTYEDGAGSVEVPKKVYGFAAAAGSFAEFLTWSPLLLVFMTLMLGLAIVSITAASRQSIAEKIARAERRAVERYVLKSSELHLRQSDDKDNDKVD
jgi:hypothetical protein